MPSPILPHAAGHRTFGVLPVLVAAAAVYAAFWPLMGRDIWVCYAPWLEHIARDGPLRALGTPFGDYTPPYYYMLTLATPLVGELPSEHIVKVVSLAGTLLLAGAVLRLARASRARCGSRAPSSSPRRPCCSPASRSTPR